MLGAAHLAHSGRRHLGAAVEGGDQGVEAARAGLMPRIEEEHVAGVNSLQRPVARVAEAALGTTNRAHANEVALHVGGCAPAAGVDDHRIELEPAGPPERAGQRRAEPALVPVGDDDQADVVYGALLPPAPAIQGSIRSGMTLYPPGRYRPTTHRNGTFFQPQKCEPASCQAPPRGL